MNEHDGDGDAQTESTSVTHRTAGDRQSARLQVLAFAMLTMALGTWGAWSWSPIPLDIHGRARAIEYQSESEYRWRILELDDGRSFVIDRRITAQLGDWQKLGGQRVDTDSGARVLRVGDHTAHLAPSVEFWRILFSFAVFTVLVVARGRWRFTRRLGSLGRGQGGENRRVWPLPMR